MEENKANENVQNKQEKNKNFTTVQNPNTYKTVYQNSK